MNTKHQIPAIAAMTLAAVMSISLIACNESTTTKSILHSSLQKLQRRATLYV